MKDLSPAELRQMMAVPPVESRQMMDLFPVELHQMPDVLLVGLRQMMDLSLVELHRMPDALPAVRQQIQVFRAVPPREVIVLPAVRTVVTGQSLRV